MPEKLCHQVVLSVFAKCDEEDPEKARLTLINLLGIDAEKEKIEVKERTADGFSDRKIKIYEILLQKQRHITEFIEKLKSRLSSQQKELLLRQLGTRLDDGLHFYIRLDKQRMMNGEYWITDSGDCFHMKLSVAAFPSTRECAEKMLRAIFGADA